MPRSALPSPALPLVLPSVLPLVLTLALGSALAGCSGDSADPSADPSASPPAETSASETSASETLEPPEPTQVAFGDEQSVTWAPTQALAGDLTIRVDAVRRGRLADFAGLVAAGIGDDNQPYYVDAVITNEGDAELGGLDIPLYLLDSAQTLTPASRFVEPFEPCASRPLPDPFGAGEEVETCLVFVAAPGADLESITFRPTLDGPVVSWSGEVDPPTRRRR